MPPFPGQSRTRRRPVAYGLSLLLVGLHLFGLAHLALERHGVCWEHGTVTELGRTEQALALPDAVATTSGLHAGHSVAQLQEAEDHHCPVQVSRRDWGNPPAGALLALLTPARPRLLAWPPSVLSVDETLLHRAPKQSPPFSA